MKIVKIIAISLLFHQITNAYWHDSNETGLSSEQRHKKYDDILKNISAQIESLKDELNTTESKTEAKNKLIDLRNQIANEKNGVKNGDIRLLENIHRQFYAGGLQVSLNKIEALLHPKPARPTQYWHDGNELELDHYRRRAKYTTILDARRNELDQITEEFEEYGTTPSLKNKLIDLHNHLDHEIRGLNTGNIRMIEANQLSAYRGGLLNIKTQTEDLLKQTR